MTKRVRRISISTYFCWLLCLYSTPFIFLCRLILIRVTKPHAAMKRLNARMLKNGMKILSYKTARGYEALKQQYAGSRTVYLVTKPHAAMKRLNVSLISLFLTFPKGYKTARGYEALKRCEWCAENDATHCYKTARGYEALKPDEQDYKWLRRRVTKPHAAMKRLNRCFLIILPKPS